MAEGFAAAPTGGLQLSQGVSSLKLECFDTGVWGLSTLGPRAGIPRREGGRLAAAEAVKTLGLWQPPPLLLPATLGRPWQRPTRCFRPAAIMRRSFWAMGCLLLGLPPPLTFTSLWLAAAACAAAAAEFAAANAAAAAAEDFDGSGNTPAAAAGGGGTCRPIILNLPELLIAGAPAGRPKGVTEEGTKGVTSCRGGTAPIATAGMPGPKGVTGELVGVTASLVGVTAWVLSVPVSPAPWAIGEGCGGAWPAGPGVMGPPG